MNFTLCNKSVIFLFALLSTCTVFPVAADGNSIGRIASLLGSGTLVRQANKIPLVIAGPLQAGDRLVTDDHTRMQLEFAGRTRVLVGENTELEVVDYKLLWGAPSNLRLQLDHGSLRVFSLGDIELVHEPGVAVHAPGDIENSETTDIWFQSLQGVTRLLVLQGANAVDITTANTAMFHLSAGQGVESAGADLLGEWPAGAIDNALRSVAWPEGLSTEALPLP